MAVVAVIVAVIGFLVDSATDDPETAASSTPVAAAEEEVVEDVPLDELTGDFIVSGSSTVFPIVQLQAERFQEVAPGVAISVEGPGSGDGAQLFCNGDVPIANASRLYKQEEIDLCVENGIEFIEIRRAVDGITLITSPENDDIDCVSFNDLYALLSSEAQGFTSWSDANAITSTWGGTQFPDGLALDVFGPGEESGTFDSFTEIVIEGVADGDSGLDPASREFVETIRPDYASSGNDNVIVTGVESSTHSIGWIGYAFAAEAAEAGSAKLLRVSVEDGGTCVSPNEETIGAAAFPVSRFLYTYVSATAAEEDQAVRDFVDYMLSDEGATAVTEVGYIELPTADLTRAKTIWRAGLTGTGQWIEE
ncbi:MAG: substrate-binding domain-containing protein [Actinomycetota bacterium]